jgi:hypothetical protein
MTTTAVHLPLAHAYLRLAEGSPPAPRRSRAATTLAALLAALVLAVATPLMWAAAVSSSAERPAGTLPGKVVPALDDLDADAPGGG